MDYSTSRSNKFLAPIIPTFVTSRSILNSSLVPKSIMHRSYFLFNGRDNIDAYLHFFADFSQTTQFTASLHLINSRFQFSEEENIESVKNLLQKLIDGTPYFCKSLRTMHIQ